MSTFLNPLSTQEHSMCKIEEKQCNIKIPPPVSFFYQKENSSMILCEQVGYVCCCLPQPTYKAHPSASVLVF